MTYCSSVFIVFLIGLVTFLVLCVKSMLEVDHE